MSVKGRPEHLVFGGSSSLSCDSYWSFARAGFVQESAFGVYKISYNLAFDLISLFVFSGSADRADSYIGIVHLVRVILSIA